MIQKGEVLIAIWAKGHDPMDSLIKIFTRGRGTHAAFRRGNGRIIENFYPRVRERDLAPGEAVEFYRIAGSTPLDWQRLEGWFNRQLKHPPAYCIVDLFRYAADLPPVDGRSCFCSQWVLRGCRLCLPWHRQPLMRLEYPDWASPTMLRSSPRLIAV